MRVLTSIRQHQLLAEGEQLLLAVSGGVDSMVLLHLLGELAPVQGWQVSVAHFNHQLRGRAGNADEVLVGKTARSFGMPFLAGRGDVRGYAKRKGISLEMAGRQLRHEFLARVALERGLRRIALAHQADDQVELFFLRLFRGAGSEGLSGMKWSSPSPANPEVTLVRPLLAESKRSIEEYARARKIRFLEDATNRSNDFLRNRIRRELVPILLRSFQPALSRTIPRLMSLLGAEADYIDTEARRWLDAPSTSFIDLPVAIQRRCLQIQLFAAGVVPNFELVEQLRMTPGKPVCVPCPEGAGTNWDEEDLGFGETPGKESPPSGSQQASGSQATAVMLEPSGKLQVMHVGQNLFSPDSLKIDLTLLPGTASFSGLTVRWGILSRTLPRPWPKRPGFQFFDADRVGKVLVLRHWQPGDRFHPIGMPQSVKLQDFFVNQKVPRARRHGLVVAATAQGELVWVEGMRISERFKLSGKTKRLLQWSWSKE
jgi:tRNA(Ile)-lysidine synthase